MNGDERRTGRLLGALAFLPTTKSASVVLVGALPFESLTPASSPVTQFVTRRDCCQTSEPSGDVQIFCSNLVTFKICR
jgi:hypothetical protein